MDKQFMIDEINRLRKEKNVVILAHYYQYPEIQDIADFVGDSLLLSRKAAETDADIILFCGVHFMAETAKILSPNKKVLLPDLNAGCPMADCATEAALLKYKEKHPDTKVVCYVNSTASIKALSHVCVTSTNAKKIAKTLVGEKLLYVPDHNLGNYLNKQIPGLNMDLWPGHCCIHNDLFPGDVIALKQKYPNAKFIVHPEANEEVVGMGDFVGSTQQLLNFTAEDSCQEFIVGTEKGILHKMQEKSPEKNFHILTEDLRCRTMKMITLEKVYQAIKDDQFEIHVDEDIAKKANQALVRMLELS